MRTIKALSEAVAREVQNRRDKIETATEEIRSMQTAFDNMDFGTLRRYIGMIDAAAIEAQLWEAKK